MSHLLLMDLCVLIFGVISLLRAIRFLGHPPLRNRMFDLVFVISFLIIYPGQRFTEPTVYHQIMEFAFVMPLILLVAYGCLILLYAMISAYIGLIKSERK